MNFPRLEFQVVSTSSGEVYFIEIVRKGANLTCTCTCPAGSNGTHCKHRLSILRGDAGMVNAGDTDQMHWIPQMLAGTDVEQAMARLDELEAQKAEIDRQFKAAKKALARTLDN
jgi:uncharacterized Zn finger protein